MSRVPLLFLHSDIPFALGGATRSFPPNLVLEMETSFGSSFKFGGLGGSSHYRMLMVLEDRSGCRFFCLCWYVNRNVVCKLNYFCFLHLVVLLNRVQDPCIGCNINRNSNNKGFGVTFAAQQFRPSLVAIHIRTFSALGASEGVRASTLGSSASCEMSISFSAEFLGKSVFDNVMIHGDCLVFKHAMAVWKVPVPQIAYIKIRIFR